MYSICIVVVWVDNTKECRIPPILELLTKASCRKDWKRISADSSVVSPWWSIRSGGRTEMNWTKPPSIAIGVYTQAQLQRMLANFQRVWEGLHSWITTPLMGADSLTPVKLCLTGHPSPNWGINICTLWVILHLRWVRLLEVGVFTGQSSSHVIQAHSGDVLWAVPAQDTHLSCGVMLWHQTCLGCKCTKFRFTTKE